MIGNGLSLTLRKCEVDISNDIEKIKDFINNIINLIDMKPLGSIIIRKGSEHLPGYSAVQIIETSHIALHTFSKNNSYMFGIESCKSFDMGELYTFIIDFLKCKDSRINADYKIVMEGVD